MTDLEQAEQKLEEVLENLNVIVDLVDDAETAFVKAFKEGFEKMEGHMDDGFAKLDEIKVLL